VIDKIINVPPSAPMIDMNYFSQYEMDIGFRVGVEAIINNTEKAFFGVVMSICPPASFYNPARNGAAPDVRIILWSLIWTCVGDHFYSS
jgi:hypothetical protein